jgi:hypothetical protein
LCPGRGGEKSHHLIIIYAGGGFFDGKAKVKNAAASLAARQKLVACRGSRRAIRRFGHWQRSPVFDDGRSDRKVKSEAAPGDRGALGECPAKDDSDGVRLQIISMGA